LSKSYKIVPFDVDQPCLILHSGQIKQMENSRMTTIHFGLQELEVACSQSSKLKDNEIGISNQLISMLKIPLGVDYELSFQAESIIIGPFIGYLIGKTHSETKRRLKKFKRINIQYPFIGGLIIAFSWEEAVKINSTIKGFMYDPSSGKWKEGTYPLPAVLANRMYWLSNKRKKVLKSIYGQRFFNSAAINKWKMHKLLSANEDLLQHLPKTILYKKPEDIPNYLHRFRKLYVKPIVGKMGIGIVQIISEDDSFCIKYRKGNKNQTEHFSSEADLLEYAAAKFKKNKFIIQEPIKNELKDRQVIDFRIFLVKNQSGQWEDVGMIARKGSKGSIVSNLSNGGLLISPNKTIMSSFHLSKSETRNIRKKMSDIAIKAIKEIDKYENIYKYGVDIALDRQCNIFLIELNHINPGYRDELPAEATARIRDSMLSYAKYLAGFPKFEDKSQ